MPATNVIAPGLTKVDSDRAPFAHHQSRPDSPTRIDVLVRRIRAGYLDTPGLALTVDEAQYLWRLDQIECEALLAAFVAAGFLRRSRGGAFTRARSTTAVV